LHLVGVYIIYGFYYRDTSRCTVNKILNISIKFELLMFPRKQVSASHHESFMNISEPARDSFLV